MAWAEPAGKKGWRGRYRDASGSIHTAGYANTKRKAEKLGEDQEAKIRAGTWFDPMAGKITFSEYFENHWIVNRTCEVNTVETYWSHYRAALKPEFGDMQLRHILPSTVQGWVARMAAEGRVKPSTIRARVKALQTVLAAKKGASAMRDRLIASNPCHGVQLPAVVEPEVEVYTPEQVEQLIEALDEWWRLLPLFTASTGLRWGEVMGLQVCDFTPGYRSLAVNRTIVEASKARTGNGTRFRTKEYPKGKHRRRVILDPEMATAVESLALA